MRNTAARKTLNIYLCSYNTIHMYVHFCWKLRHTQIQINMYAYILYLRNVCSTNNHHVSRGVVQLAIHLIYTSQRISRCFSLFWYFIHYPHTLLHRLFCHRDDIITHPLVYLSINRNTYTVWDWTKPITPLRWESTPDSNLLLRLRLVFSSLLRGTL